MCLSFRQVTIERSKFFEWADKEHKAKIRSFGGGSGYEEFLKNSKQNMQFGLKIQILQIGRKGVKDYVIVHYLNCYLLSKFHKIE